MVTIKYFDESYHWAEDEHGPVANLSGLAYIIIQRGRTYFENRDKISYLRSHFRNVHEEKVNGHIAAEVF